MNDHWLGRRVLITGHTGFKGSWLSLWLARSGAEVTGLSLGVPTVPSHFELIRLADLIDDRRGDVRDYESVANLCSRLRPQVVFHFAAQSLVRRSYEDPLKTFSTNILGTANVLQAARASDAEAVVVATSDKCYENNEWRWGYREGDPLGGHDPYSASKAAAELVVGAYRRSYPGPTAIASVRAGNVIGPGDWSADRLVPDALRAAISGHQLEVRNPGSTRPWQDVLDSLAGYVRVAERLLEGHPDPGAWNIGPPPWETASVRTLIEHLAQIWPGGFSWSATEEAGPHEAHTLGLDATLARQELGWLPRRTLEQTLAAIADWHHGAHTGRDPRQLSETLLVEYWRGVAT